MARSKRQILTNWVLQDGRYAMAFAGRADGVCELPDHHFPPGHPAIGTILPGTDKVCVEAAIMPATVECDNADDLADIAHELTREASSADREIEVSILVRAGSVLFNVFTLWPQGSGLVDPATLSVSGAGTLVAIRTADDTADPPTFAAGDVYLTRDPTPAQLTPGNTRTLTVTGTIPAHQSGVDPVTGDPIIEPARQISRDVVIGVHNRDAKPTAAEWDNLWTFAESKLGRSVPQTKRDQIMASDPTWEQIAKRIVEKGWA